MQNERNHDTPKLLTWTSIMMWRKIIHPSIQASIHPSIHPSMPASILPSNSSVHSSVLPSDLSMHSHLFTNPCLHPSPYLSLYIPFIHPSIHHQTILIGHFLKPRQVKNIDERHIVPSVSTSIPGNNTRDNLHEFAFIAICSIFAKYILMILQQP